MSRKDVTPVAIRDASTADDYAAFGSLIRDYVDWSRTRYAHDQSFVEQVFGHQSLDAELKALPASYGPPNGRTLLATMDGEIHGAGAYRRLSSDICEMKRLFVPKRYQGSGIGRRLAEAIMAAASDDGYALMRLDTARLLTEAITMYSSLGFHECAPYHQYPDDLMPHIVFMERELRSRK